MAEVMDTQTQTLEETLNKTDLGHVFYENRRLFLGFIVLILLGALSWAGWSKYQESVAQERSLQVFTFQQKVWEEAKTGKMSPEEFMTKFKALNKDLKSSSLMAPLVLEMSKHFLDKGSLEASMLVLEDAVGAKTHPVFAYFIKSQKMVILEKNKDLKAALAIAQELKDTKDNIFPAKALLHLGRLHLLNGDKEKAKSEWQNLVATYPNDEEAKMAKIYLSENL